MGNPADWLEDGHHRLYYGGTMPADYREESPARTAPQGHEDETPIGYEAAQPALQPMACADGPA